jgi:uncharacterized protein (DUF697 family)
MARRRSRISQKTICVVFQIWQTSLRSQPPMMAMKVEGSMSAADEKADTAIAVMISGMMAAAIIPAHVNWALVAGALGTGVVAIGRCYGVQLSKDEAWQLVKQFFLAAGLTFIGLAVGTKIIAAILSSTGIGHLGAVALDASVSAALAYAVGGSAKAYFKGERDKKKLGRIFRDLFKKKKDGEGK